MKEKNKNISFIAMGMVILLIILLIVNIVLMSYKINIIENLKNGLYDSSSENETLPDYIKTPNKSYAFLADYSGNISSIKAYTAFYELANNTIPTYYKELKDKSSNQVEQYFEQNKDEIYTKLGIDNKNDFANLIKYITNLKVTELEFESYEFDRSSININKDETSANLEIIYKNNNSITVNITLLENINNGAILKVEKAK